MTDERLRKLERTWNETHAHADRAAFETELYRAGKPFAEAMIRTRGGVIASVNTPECAFSKYVSEKNRLVNRFMWRAEETRQADGPSHAIETTYARLGRLDDIVRTLLDINHNETAVIYRGRAAISEFAHNNDFEHITTLLAVETTPVEFYQQVICEYLARGREKEAAELRDREEIEIDAREMDTTLARFHASNGRYNQARQHLARESEMKQAKFLAIAAAERKDYDSARKLAEGYPHAIEAAARYAARNGDYDVAFEIAPTGKHRSAAAYLAILEEAAKKKDYTVAQEAMRGAFVLSGQANRALWIAATRNGDFDIAAPYAPRKKTANNKEDLAIGNLRAGNLKDAQKFARTAITPSSTYCNLALALSGKELINWVLDD